MVACIIIGLRIDFSIEEVKTLFLKIKYREFGLSDKRFLILVLRMDIGVIFWVVAAFLPSVSTSTTTTTMTILALLARGNPMI